ncbi:MAG: YcjX family protein [Alphaproteobacteria bacterium]|nr:MAG: YcjX family protein [Alphaproteobacteria bacterium]
MAGIADIADGLLQGIEDAGARVSEALFEPVVRLGVTGLSRAGKTVFITSLVANLIDRGRMTGLRAAAEGRIRAAYLEPQPDDTVPRFDYEAHLDALVGPDPKWPASTRSISELRLSLRIAPRGLWGAVAGARTVHIDIVDYPGEWLLDLGLMDRDFAGWSAAVLDRARGRDAAARYLALATQIDGAGPVDEPAAAELAAAWTDYLRALREAGLSDCTPGRFLLPGDLAGAPVLTFGPLPAPARAPGRRSMWAEMARRFEAYKREVVRPFFRDHFARIDRQIVLADVLGAIHHGPEALEDLRRALATTLKAFRPGRNSWLFALLGRRVERILFAATKADHIHHVQHPRLEALMAALVAEARARAEFSGAETAAMAIAAVRATVEEERRHQGAVLPCVRGRLEDGRQAAFWPGELPEDPAALLSPARSGAGKWLAGDYEMMKFLPQPLSRRAGEGPPHIRLDRAAEFLIGDKLG